MKSKPTKAKGPEQSGPVQFPTSFEQRLSEYLESATPKARLNRLCSNPCVADEAKALLVKLEAGMDVLPGIDHLEYRALQTWAVSKISPEITRRRSAGRASAEARRERAAAAWADRATKEAKRLIEAGISPRNVSSMLATRLGKDVGTVRRSLKKAGVI